MKTRQHRLISWLMLLLAVAIPLALVINWAASPSVVRVDRERIDLTFSTSRHLVLPGSCATVRWSAKGVFALTFDDRIAAPEDLREVCPDESTGYTLAYITGTGAPIRHSLFVRVLFTTTNTRLWGAAFAVYAGLAVFAVALVGDLPGLSPLLRPLRRWFIRVAHLAELQASTRPLVASLRAIPVMFRKVTLRRDAFYLTMLGVIAAIPLIVLRYVPGLQATGSGPLWVLLWLVALFGWLRPTLALWRARRAPAASVAQRRTSFVRATAISAVLLACAVAGFYRPMQGQFWMGGDEIRVLEDATRGWASIPFFDATQGRPLTPLAAIVVGQLTPGRIEGFLWLALALRLLSGALVYGLLRVLLPRRGLLALAAGLLFIVNPSEPTRFLAVYMQGYNALVFLLLLSLYLYARADRANNRLLLALSCVALGSGLLIAEPGGLLALMWPVLAALMMGRRRALLWIYAWLLTMALVAGRFALYQVTTQVTYQQEVLASGIAPQAWIAQFLRQFAAMARFGALYDPTWRDGLIGLALGAFVAAAIIALARVHPMPVAIGTSSRRYKVALLLALGAMTLGFLPFVTITGILGTIRTQFLAAPAQAIALALLIGWSARFVALRFRVMWVAALTGLLVMLPTVSAPSSQAHRPVNPDARYTDTACIAQQMLEQAPAVGFDTIILVLQDENSPSPLGWNYYVYSLIDALYGVEGYPLHYTDSLGVRYTLNHNEPRGGASVLPYTLNRLVAFEIGRDRTVRLLEQLPASALPPNRPDGEGYDPHARILPGEPDLPPFLRCDP